METEDKKKVLKMADNINEIYDPFYSENNQARLNRAIESIEAGKVMGHELIED